MATRIPVVNVNGNYQELPAGDTIAVPSRATGTFFTHGGRTAPAGSIACDHANLLRADYPNLFAVRCEAIGTATITIASPAVVTVTGHKLAAGDRIFFETTGALPTGLSANTEYYVISAGLTADNFEVSSTIGGSAINTSGSQSGVHTLRWCPDGIADSTHFYAPDVRGISFVGSGSHATMTRADGSAYDGGSVGATRSDQIQGFRMDVKRSDGANVGDLALSSSAGGTAIAVTGGTQNYQAYAFITDGTNGTPRTGNETRPAQMAVLVCIQT